MDNNSCLLAVLLTISTHQGPRFVFHYPPHPDTNNYEADLFEDNDLQDTSEDSEYFEHEISEESTDEDEAVGGRLDSGESQDTPPTPKNLLETLERRHRKQRRETIDRNPSKAVSKQDSNVKSSEVSSASSVREQSSSRQRETLDTDKSTADQNNTVLGFDTDFLSELLCPARAMCNMKFEMTVDEMSFIGIPVHVLPDGQWRRRKRIATMSRTNNSTVVPPSRSTAANSDSDITDNSESEMESDADGSEKPAEQDQDEYNDPRSSMRMFHIVFVMNPNLNDYFEKTAEMYHFVLSQFTAVLRTEQARDNYVWEQVNQIINTREKKSSELQRSELWKVIVSESNLAAAMRDLYYNISQNSIANIDINHKVQSFQIPPQREFERLPALITPEVRGCFLTTATTNFTASVMADRASEHSEDCRRFGILLLDDPETIIRDMHADTYVSLAVFIRGIDPTLSIEELSALNGRSVVKVVELAQSLVYWRRARFIVPISHKNTFVVSPLADMQQINEYNERFKEQFPGAPLTVQKLLSMLSTGKPRPYLNVIPSRDHRELYINALAWCMKYGLVMQLQTFAYLRVSKKIKADVNRDVQIEKDMAEYQQDGNLRATKLADNSTDNTAKREAGKEPSGGSIASSPKRSNGLHIPGTSSKLRSTMSVNALSSSFGTHSISDSDEFDHGFEQDEFNIEENIMLDPSRASALEKRWIARITSVGSPEQQLMFGKLQKYFNGSVAIEEALTLEGYSRGEWRRFREKYEAHLCLVRHW